MRKYYNFDTRFISFRDALKRFLKDNNIDYELSGNYSYYHFEILANKIELDKINDVIDSQIITEVI